MTGLEYLEPFLSFLGGVRYFYRTIKNWWSISRPAKKLLQDFSDDNKEIKIFVRDFFINPGTTLLVREGLNGQVGYVPNVFELWPRVEGIGLSKILNALGQIGKTKNIEIIEMGKDPGIWNSNIIILGAQTKKCFDFYSKMDQVAYRMTGRNIFSNITGKKISRAGKYGFGIILKTKNPFYNNKPAFLVGGYGTLGTEAATYYFANNFSLLGKMFGKNSFGIVVRALASAGVESTQRIEKYDYKFE